ncbi:MAG: alpha/beta hydrolase family protein [Anaerolineae bacterium]
MRLISIILRLLLFVTSLVLTATSLPLGAWLLFNFESWQGLILAILGIVGPLWGFWLFFGRGYPKFKQINLRCVGIVGVLTALLLILTPSGRTYENTAIRHIYSNGGRFIRFSPFNIIPEIEQMNVGTNLLGPLDAYIDKEKSDRLADLTLTIYQEMRQDADFRRAGSVMGLTLREPFQIPFDNGHTYLYIPKKASADHPVPAIVFLHGAGGAFKAYQWIWRDFAEENGFVIISPSYGAGLWPEQEGSEAVIRALDYAADYLLETDGLELNQDHIWLAGLSNGGYGTIHTATRHPDRFEGLILISPGMPSQLMIEQDGPFNTAWRGRPVLLIHGEQDLRMPMNYLNQHIGFMENGEIDLKTVLYSEEDHFLFFAQREELMETIAHWIAKP